MRLVENIVGLKGSKLAKLKIASAVEDTVDAKVTLMMQKAATNAAIKDKFPEQSIKAVTDAAAIVSELMKNIATEDGAEIKLAKTGGKGKQLITK